MICHLLFDCYILRSSRQSNSEDNSEELLTAWLVRDHNVRYLIILIFETMKKRSTNQVRDRLQPRPKRHLYKQSLCEETVEIFIQICSVCEYNVGEEQECR